MAEHAYTMPGTCWAVLTIARLNGDLPEHATAAQVDRSDSLLLSLVSRYHATQTALIPFERGPSPKFGTPERKIHEEQFIALVVERRNLLGALAATPAQTRAGRREKALILLADLPTASDVFDLGPTSEEIGLALSVAQDATRELLA